MGMSDYYKNLREKGGNELIFMPSVAGIVDEAIKRLMRANKTINFNSVASEAGVAKATLYNNVLLRERIETLRSQQIQSPSKKNVKQE